MYRNDWTDLKPRRRLIPWYRWWMGWTYRRRIRAERKARMSVEQGRIRALKYKNVIR